MNISKKSTILPNSPVYLSDTPLTKGGVTAMLDTYRAALEVRNYQKASLLKNVQLAGQFLRHSEINGLHEITVCNVEEYLIKLRSNGKSAKTIKNHRSAIKVFCDFLTTRGVLKDNPVH